MTMTEFACPKLCFCNNVLSGTDRGQDPVSQLGVTRRTRNRPNSTTFTRDEHV